MEKVNDHKMEEDGKLDAVVVMEEEDYEGQEVKKVDSDDISEGLRPESMSLLRNSMRNQTEKKIKSARMTFTSHTKPVLAVCVLQLPRCSPLVISGGEDKYLMISSLASGEGIMSLEGHVQKITGICTAQHKDRIFIVSCSWDETIRCWPVACLLNLTAKKKLDLKNEIKKKCLILKGHRNRVYDIAVLRPRSSDPLIASAAADNTVRIWSVYNTQCIHTFTNTISATWNLTIGACFSLEFGPVVIVGCKSSELVMWGLPGGIRSRDYLPSMHEITSDEEKGRDRRWSHSENPTSRDPHAMSEFRLIRVIQGHPSRITDLCVYHPDSYMNEYGDDPPSEEGGGYEQSLDREGIKEKTCDLGPIENDEPPSTQKKRRFSSTRVSHMNAGPVVVTACRDLTLRMWSIENGTLLKQFYGNTTTVNAVFIQRCADEEAILLNSCASGNIRVWDLETGELRRMLSGHTDEANGVISFTSPENDTDLLVVSGGSDTTVRFWTFKEERSLTVLQHNTAKYARTRVSEVVVFLDTEDGQPVFVTGCTNGSVYGWRLSEDLEGEIVWAVDVHRDQVTSLALYHPRQCIETIVNLTSGEELKSSKSFALLEKPLVVSGGRDNVIHFRDLGTGDAVGEQLIGHTDAITSVVVYSGGTDNVHPIAPFVVSASEDNDIRIWSLESRTCLVVLQDHDFDVTSVAIFAPELSLNKSEKTAENNSHVNSSEDLHGASVDSVSKLPPIMHSLGDSKTPLTMKKRKSDRKAKSIFSPYSQTTLRTPQGRSRQSRSSYAHDIEIVKEEDLPNVLIASCSMDGSVRLYDPYGEIIEVIRVDKVFFSFVTMLNSRDFPLLAASTLSGAVYVWSLIQPYTLLHMFKDHTDEVRALSLFLTPCRLPVLVSGSWDTTIRVYNLNTFEHMKTIEGQTGEITAIAATSYDGNEPIIASASSDGTVHIYFDFLSSSANKDVVRIAFEFDVRTAKPDQTLDEKWPRISALILSIGPKPFFIRHYDLFFKAVEQDETDFLTKFLHTSEANMIKTNQSPSGSLLYVAMRYHDISAVREIIKCWIQFLTTIPHDSHGLIYQDNATIPKSDLLLLSCFYPQEFEMLISSLILIPVPDNELRGGTIFLKGEKMYLGEVKEEEKEKLQRSKSILQGRIKHNAVSPTELSDVAGELFDKAAKGVSAAAGDRQAAYKYEDSDEDALLLNISTKEYKYYFLPLPGLVDINMLRAYTMTARSLDSFKIFDSIAGKMCQRFVWRVYGRDLHVKLFKQYVVYVFFSSLSIYIFPFCIERKEYWPLIGCLLGGQILYDIYYIYTERKQFLEHPLEYMKDMWNRLDFLVIASGLSGNVIRLLTLGDTNISRVCLSIFSICLWFNLLYFLRAFERTGPLVSMIYHIAMDIRALVGVLGLVCVGFAQAFWLLSNTTNKEAYNFQSDLPFSSVKMSYVNSFSYMLGNFESGSFAGLPLENFALLLSCLFMVIVAILLLNLLIALMGDTYGYVSSRGLAQWRLEQLDYVVENSQASSEKVKKLSKYTLYFATKHEEDENLSPGHEGGEGGTVDVQSRSTSALNAITELQLEMHEMKQMVAALQRNTSIRSNSVGK